MANFFEESEIFLFFLKKGNERVSKKLSDNIYIYKNSKGDKINWLLQSFEESGIFFFFFEESNHRVLGKIVGSYV